MAIGLSGYSAPFLVWVLYPITNQKMRRWNYTQPLTPHPWPCPWDPSYREQDAGPTQCRPCLSTRLKITSAFGSQPLLIPSLIFTSVTVISKREMQSLRRGFCINWEINDSAYLSLLPFLLILLSDMTTTSSHRKLWFLPKQKGLHCTNSL